MECIPLQAGDFLEARVQPRDTCITMMRQLTKRGIQVDDDLLMSMYKVLRSSVKIKRLPPSYGDHQHSQDPNMRSQDMAATSPPSTVMTSEDVGIPKEGPPRNVDESFYCPHTHPKFPKNVDLSDYPNPSSSMEKSAEANEVRAAHIRATKRAKAGNRKQTRHVAPASTSAPAPASKANVSPAVEVNNSAGSQGSEVQTTSQTIPVIEITEHALNGSQITSTPEMSTQGTGISSQSHESMPSTPDTVYTVYSTPSSQSASSSYPSGSTTRVKKTPVPATPSSQSASGPHFFGSTNRMKKTPISATRPRRSSPLSQSQSVTPDDVILGKRSRDSDDVSEAESSKKKTLTEADMVKLSTSKGGL